MESSYNTFKSASENVKSDGPTSEFEKARFGNDYYF